MYEDYEVHKTRPDWDGELIAVLKNGNKGQIFSMTTGGNQPEVFRVLLSEDDTCLVNVREIDHYLTPPKTKRLPTHPGLWKDKDGNFWVYESNTFGILRCIRGIYPDGPPDWSAHGVQSRVVDCKNLAPFTELEVKEKQ